VGPYEVDLDADEHAAIVEAIACAVEAGVPLHITHGGTTYTYEQND